MKRSAVIAWAGLLWLGGLAHAQGIQLAGQGTRMSAAAHMEAFARDIHSAASLASGGRLLYESDERKRDWNNYCASSRVASENGEFRRAVQEASKALFLGQQQGLVHAQAYAARDLAIALSWAGDLEQGERWAQTALELAARITRNMNVDYEIRAEALKVLGDVALRRGDAARAQQHYQQALDKFPFVGGGALKDMARLSLANALWAQKRPEAERMFSDLAGAGDVNVRLGALRGLAQWQIAQGQTEQALATITRLETAAAQARNPWHRLWALHLSARVRDRQGQADEAVRAALAAVAAVEEVRSAFRSSEMKSGFFNHVQDVFDQTIELLARHGRMAEAFDVSERSRARASLELLQRGREPAREPGPAAPAVDTVATLAQVRTRLPAATQLVSYHVLAEQTIAWRIDRDGGLHAARLPLGRQALHDEVQRLRQAIEADRMPDVMQRGRALHRALIEPLALPEGQSLIVVAHSALHFLPFQALRGPQSWLIEERALSYVLSASALPANAARAEGDWPPVLAFGNPDAGNPSLDLPGSELEVRRIAAMVPGSQVFVRDQASRQRVIDLAPGAGVLHIAAHAFVDEIDPMQSYIQMADPLLKRGQLKATDLQRLALGQSRLVTLSACSSGLGRVAQGDEFWGFKRAVLGAGAPRLLVSLWPVDDEATARLMQTFYDAARRLGMRDALRQAQLELIRQPQTASPALWAPFVLVGDPG